MLLMGIKRYMQRKTFGCADQKKFARDPDAKAKTCNGQEPVLQNADGTAVVSRGPVYEEKEAAYFLDEERQIGRKLNRFQELSKVKQKSEAKSGMREVNLTDLRSHKD